MTEVLRRGAAYKIRKLFFLLVGRVRKFNKLHSLLLKFKLSFRLINHFVIFAEDNFICVKGYQFGILFHEKQGLQRQLVSAHGQKFHLIYLLIYILHIYCF